MPVGRGWARPSREVSAHLGRTFADRRRSGTCTMRSAKRTLEGALEGWPLSETAQVIAKARGQVVRDPDACCEHEHGRDHDVGHTEMPGDEIMRTIKCRRHRAGG